MAGISNSLIGDTVLSKTVSDIISTPEFPNGIDISEARYEMKNGVEAVTFDKLQEFMNEIDIEARADIRTTRKRHNDKFLENRIVVGKEEPELKIGEASTEYPMFATGGAYSIKIDQNDYQMYLNNQISIDELYEASKKKADELSTGVAQQLN